MPAWTSASFISVAPFTIWFFSCMFYLFTDVHRFCYRSHMLVIFFFKFSRNLSAATDFPSLRVKTFQCCYHTTTTSLIYCKNHYPSLSISCFVYALFIQNFMKCIGDCNTFFNLQWVNPNILAVMCNTLVICWSSEITPTSVRAVVFPALLSKNCKLLM